MSRNAYLPADPRDLTARLAAVREAFEESNVLLGGLVLVG